MVNEFDKSKVSEQEIKELLIASAKAAPNFLPNTSEAATDLLSGCCARYIKSDGSGPVVSRDELLLLRQAFGDSCDHLSDEELLGIVNRSFERACSTGWRWIAVVFGMADDFGVTPAEIVSGGEKYQDEFLRRYCGP